MGGLAHKVQQVRVYKELKDLRVPKGDQVPKAKEVLKVRMGGKVKQG